MTGAICNIVVSNDFTHGACGTDSDGDWTCMNDLIMSHQANGYTAARHGDSGGPIFSLDGAKVTAIGTVTGGRTDDTSYMYFQDIGTAYSDFHFSIVTA